MCRNSLGKAGEKPDHLRDRPTVFPTIRNAERILVLTDNGIEESGTHRQLLERGGIYKKLYEMQWA